MKRCAAILLALAFAAPAAQAAPTLDPGDRGRAVKVLQTKLGVAADGVFGRQTARALRRFQRTNGLRVTGRLNQATRDALGLGVRRAPVSSDGGVSADDTVAVAPGGGVPAMVAAAYSAIGADYEAASAGPDTFDCSGLIVWAAEQAGIAGVPRSSFGQYELGTPVDADAIVAGDLVFFDTAGPGASDVGIATGPDSVISATTHGVREHTVSGPYWGKHYIGARRL